MYQTLMTNNSLCDLVYSRTSCQRLRNMAGTHALIDTYTLPEISSSNRSPLGGVHRLCLCDTFTCHCPRARDYFSQSEPSLSTTHHWTLSSKYFVRIPVLYIICFCCFSPKVHINKVLNLQLKRGVIITHITTYICFWRLVWIKSNK